MKAICLKNYHLCKPSVHPSYNGRVKYWLKRFRIYDYWIECETFDKKEYVIVDETILNNVSRTHVRFGKESFYEYMMPIEEK